MLNRTLAWSTATELDEMIVRAEAACERYRVHAERVGERRLTMRQREVRRVMEETLERLRQQRERGVLPKRLEAP